MKYEFAPDLQILAEEISFLLFPHIQMERVKCLRSHGTSSRGTIARCHALGKLMQKAIERFDNLDPQEQIKVIIHELMHIPKSFGGGFKHHDVVTDRNVTICYKEYILRKKEQTPPDSLGLDLLKKNNQNNLNFLKQFFK